jgi:hypothetical protein
VISSIGPVVRRAPLTFRRSSSHRPQPAISLQHLNTMIRTRHAGAARRFDMEIIGIVMVGSIVLYMFQQVGDLTD